MLENIVEKDLDELGAHIKMLADKYGEDFCMIGNFGICCDETPDGSEPMYESLVLFGDANKIHHVIHKMLDHADSVKLLMDAIRCHCKKRLNNNDEVKASMRDLALLMVEKSLVEHAKKKEVDLAVNNLLKDCGLA